VASVNVDLDQSGIDRAKEELVWFDENGTRHSVFVDIEDTQLTDVEKKIQELPSEKLLEIQLQGDIDTQIAAIEAQAETAQAAFKYTAEVDIAKAQANADILVSAYEAAGQSVEALAGSTADMFGSLLSSWDSMNSVDQSVFMRQVEDQQEAQNKLVESQVALNEAQEENLRAKTEAMERGDAMIQIDSTGLEPALEMIMWQIIEKVQIRANESSADFLLGLNA
jgi:hypothetical protein